MRERLLSARAHSITEVGRARTPGTGAGPQLEGPNYEDTGPEWTPVRDPQRGAPGWPDQSEHPAWEEGEPAWGPGQGDRTAAALETYRNQVLRVFLPHARVPGAVMANVAMSLESSQASPLPLACLTVVPRSPR